MILQITIVVQLCDRHFMCSCLGIRQNNNTYCKFFICFTKKKLKTELSNPSNALRESNINLVLNVLNWIQIVFRAKIKIKK
jgi:hypothetical protein